MFNYSASGNIYIRGCATVDHTLTYIYKFDVGSTAYIKDAAVNKCRLEKVVIKKIRVVDYGDKGTFNPFPYEQYYFVYYDTFNAIHNEEGLCTYEEAVDLVEQCDARKAALAESFSC